jgi:hypothetical protein
MIIIWYSKDSKEISVRMKNNNKIREIRLYYFKNIGETTASWRGSCC